MTMLIVAIFLKTLLSAAFSIHPDTVFSIAHSFPLLGVDKEMSISHQTDLLNTFLMAFCRSEKV